MIFCYLVIKVISNYCIVYEFLELGVLFIFCIIIEMVYSEIGIDIYLGVRIGIYFMIDYGIGVVIGVISIIGNNVKFY